MATKNIILSKKDATLIEDLIVNHGRIVSYDQVQEVFGKQYTETSLRRRVSLLAKLGWFVRLKKGLYVIVTDIGSLSANDISVNTMIQALNKNSYVSFENALQYHGMFDQMLSGGSAVTFTRARTYKVQEMQIKFFKIQKELYFGFSEERADMGLVNIAEKEKALLDILYFSSSQYYASLVWEKLKSHRDIIDFELLKKYALKFNLTVVRRIGFFLDRLEIGTEDLQKTVFGKKSYSKITNRSKKFNAKWRLYVEDSIVE